MDTDTWTDEEICQVYDLQHGYEKAMLDFVRREEPAEVMGLLVLLPKLYGYEDKPYVFSAEEVPPAVAAEWGLPENYRDFDYIYDNNYYSGACEYKTADDLREVFEHTFQNEFGTPHPEILALLGDSPKAKEHYQEEDISRLRIAVPERFSCRMEQLLEKYPEDIREKAMETQVYGLCISENRPQLYAYSNSHMTEDERFRSETEGIDANTKVAAYDLQTRIREANPLLTGSEVLRAVGTFRLSPEHIRKCYGSKVYRSLANTPDHVLSLASRWDFTNTEERIPELTVHNICLYGTEAEKLAILQREDSYRIADCDWKTILSAMADRCEREGFARRYVPKREDPLHYLNKEFRVIGRVMPCATDAMPAWNIDFGDGNIIRASADEIIPSMMPVLQKDLYLPDPTPRSLEEAMAPPEKQSSITRKEAEKELADLLQDFRQKGVRDNGIRELLARAGHSLQNAQGR